MEHTLDNGTFVPAGRGDRAALSSLVPPGTFGLLAKRHRAGTSAEQSMKGITAKLNRVDNLTEEILLRTPQRERVCLPEKTQSAGRGRMKPPPMVLSGEDIRELLLSLCIAIAHEQAVIETLQADQDLRCLPGSTQDRRQQIAKFEKVRSKLHRMDQEREAVTRENHRPTESQNNV
jgi:hypothetical protein